MNCLRLVKILLKYSLVFFFSILFWLPERAVATDLFVLQQSNNRLYGVFDSLYEQRWPAEPFQKESQLFKNALGFQADTLNSGYVWRPWFSLWNLGGTLKFEETLNAFQESNSTSELFGSGNSELTIFPTSRFPFSARVSHSDSRTESAVDDKIQQTMFGLYQSYQPVSKDATYQASVERRMSRIEGSGETVYDQVKLSTGHSLGTNSFQNNINWIAQENQNTGILGNELFEQFQYFGKHTWRPKETLNTDSFISFVDDETEYTNSGYHNKDWQANGTINWTPNTEKHTRIVASSRVKGEVRDVETASATDSSSQLDDTFNRAAIYYDYTENLQLNSEITYGASKSEDVTHTSDQRIGYSYAPTGTDFSGFQYQWQNSGLVSNRFTKQQDISAEDIQLANVSLSHSVMKGFFNESGAPIDGGLTQSVSYNGTTDTESQSVMILNNRLSFSSTQFDRGIYNYYQLSFDDVRNFGSRGLNESTLQIINAQISHNEKIDRATGWDSDISVQVLRNDDEERDRIQWFANGNISYTTNRFLKINKLRFHNQLLITYQDFIKEEVKESGLESGDIGAQMETSFESRLKYSIGMLQLESLLRVSRNNNGNYDSFIRFHLERRFELY